MKKVSMSYVKIGIIGLLIVLIGGCQINSQNKKAFTGEEGVMNYSNLNFQDNPGDFRFAVIGDRTGGHRPGVFPAAVDILNLMQPEFVMNVGDLIEGYVEDEEVLKAMWNEVDESLSKLEAPLFFVPGNHDINFDPSEKVWFDRAGVDRSYSHFIYKGVLFLLMSTEDPAKNDPGSELEEKYERVKAGKVTPEEGRAIVEELEHWAGKVNISDAQVEYFRKVLEENQDVRWTIGFLHTPAWAQPDPGNFAAIESLLADQPYTMFAGHTHTYKYTVRNGRDYITMGMTGGLSPTITTTGNMDHIAWVTMTDNGPVISNLLLNGVMDKRGATPGLKDFAVYRPRQITQPGLSLGIRTVPNLRDMGGYKTKNGNIVANGLLYRANQLSGIRADDMQKIGDLKLKNAFDLRTKPERDLRPDELPKDVNLVILDVLADAEQANPAILEKLMKNPAMANEELGGGKAEAGFIESYKQFVMLPSAQKAFSEFYQTIADENQLPALFHCTTGKDRTGWAAASFLTLLGVPEDVVMKDYLRSNDYILTAYKDVIDAFVEAGGERSIPEAILGVKKEYLEAAFTEMRENYGSIENYFSEGLGINAEQQQAIKDIFLFP